MITLKRISELRAAHAALHLTLPIRVRIPPFITTMSGSSNIYVESTLQCRAEVIAASAKLLFEGMANARGYELAVRQVPSG